MQQRVLITGGSGFIGTNLVAHYLAQGVPVLNLDNKPPRAAAHASVWRGVDLLDRPALQREIEAFAPNVIHHFAARTDLAGRGLRDYSANTTGLANLIDVADRLAGLERIVFASSRLVCRIGYQPRHDADYCPTTAYGESKAIGERLVRDRCGDARYDWLLVRPTSIWGPWFDIPYRTFFDAVRRGRYAHPRGRRIRKSFGYVGNTVYQLQRLMLAAAADVRGRTLYLCDYDPIEVGSWGDAIQQAFGAPPVRRVPLWLLRGTALAGDVLEGFGMRNAPLTRFRLENLLTEMLHETAPLRAICGALPFSVEEGVKQTVAWMQAAER